MTDDSKGRVFTLALASPHSIRVAGSFGQPLDAVLCFILRDMSTPTYYPGPDIDEADDVQLILHSEGGLFRRPSTPPKAT
jgi:hypothetical protein